MKKSKRPRLLTQEVKDLLFSDLLTALTKYRIAKIQRTPALAPAQDPDTPVWARVDMRAYCDGITEISRTSELLSIIGKYMKNPIQQRHGKSTPSARSKRH